mgnify:CR=1 FL=1
MDIELVRKYNVPGPRYTSYPTVPYWSRTPSTQGWLGHAKRAFDRCNGSEGISLYVHLPYCESLCTYCGCNTRITVNHAVEGPYIDSVLAEWRIYRATFGEAPRIRELHLGGGTPTFFAPAQLKRLVEGLLDGCTVARDVEMGFEGHPNNTTREHLDTLYALGFRRVSYGIQDFDERVQHIINRVQPFERVAQAFADARAAGFTGINADLVFGLPFQTPESMERTIALTNRLRPDRIAFYSYAHVPWIKPGQRRFTEADLPADAEKRTLYELGKRRFEEAGYLEIGMDHFALPHDALSIAMERGTLHRNFMGYTPVRTGLMIGLGVSAIGDAWTCFAQNLKTVEQYQDAVNSGTLPMLRGHVLTDDDLHVRRAILDVMCRFSTDLAGIGWDADDVEAHFFDLAADGLVEQEGTRIHVTRKGRPFVRNVCMAFDPDLGRERDGDRPRFSMTV